MSKSNLELAPIVSSGFWSPMNVACSLKSRTTRGHNPDFENHQPPDSRDVSKLQIQKDQMTKDMELEKRQTEIEKLKRKLRRSAV